MTVISSPAMRVIDVVTTAITTAACLGRWVRLS